MVPVPAPALYYLGGLDISDMKIKKGNYLDQVEWQEIKTPDVIDGSFPHATHEGIFRVGEFEFHVAQLNTGERIIVAEDIEHFFDALLMVGGNG